MSGVSIAEGVVATDGSGGSGTVSTVSVVTANGYSGSVANPTTTPAITITGPRTPLTADKTLYVRTPAHIVTFTNASANVGWATHGLSVNDAVVLSILPNMGAATVTIASPAVFTKVGHGYAAGQPLRLDTTGAVPTGLTAGGTVYVIAAGLAADTFEVSATAGGAAINTTGTQSGTHYVSQVGAMPTFSTAGLLVEGTVYYVKTVVSANAITLSTTAGGAALGTATVATGLPIYSGSTGSDSNDGTANDRAHALLTINKALTNLRNTVDAQGYAVIAGPAESVYDESLLLPSMVGITTDPNVAQDFCSIVGQTGNYTGNVIIRPSTAFASPINSSIAQNAPWFLDNLSLDATVAGAFAGVNVYQARVDVGHLIVTVGPSYGVAFNGFDHSTLFFSSPVIVSAPSGMASFAAVSYVSAISTTTAVTVLNAPVGGPFLDVEYQSFADTSGMVGSSGTFTGASIKVEYGSTLIGPVANIPGTSFGTVDASSNVNGATLFGGSDSVAAKTANYTAVFGDGPIYYDSTAGGFTLKVPAAPLDNQTIVFKKVSTDANTVTFDGNGHNIDGVATFTDAATNRPSFTLVYSTALGYWSRT